MCLGEKKMKSTLFNAQIDNIKDVQVSKGQVKHALNLHLISINKMLIGHYIWYFLDALVLLFLTKVVPNSTIRRFCFCIFFFKILMPNCPNFMANLSQIAPKSSLSAPMQKINSNKVPKRCWH